MADPADPHSSRPPESTTVVHAESEAPLQSTRVQSIEAFGIGTVANDPLAPAAAYRREGSRYTIRNRHAEGGLGVVFVARDGELGRHVALKEMKPGTSADYHREFQREAEITGNLEHPGIVPVYGLGTYSDGRPFYAMRFVEGQNLDAAIKSHHAKPTGVGFRQLLSRFVAVCNAIAYAHSRGIIHRDIKPANIMLGKFGETLVVDWGLAKTVGDSDATDTDRLVPLSGSGGAREGSVKGTPSFMAPEQARGNVGGLAPACDIYSLGATLYVLLAGRAPFVGGPVREILNAVEAGRFVPPRQARKDAPAALSAVCCRAMSLKPEDRYPSALALAEEVERYLADEPVLAYREPFVLRARRWMRKHPGLVSAVSAAVLVGGVALAAGMLVVQGKNRQLDAANVELKRTNDDLVVARTEAEANGKAAIASRDLAQDRFRLALDAFADSVFDIQTELDNRPDTQTLKKGLLEKAKRGLKTLLEAQAAGRLDGDRTLMWSRVKLGDVLLVTGETAAAKAEFESAVEAMQALAGAEPSDAGVQRDLSIALERLGDVRKRLGKTAEAVDAFERALVLRDELAAVAPKNLQAQGELAITLSRLGEMRLQGDRIQDALALYQRALALREAILAAAPNDPAARHGLTHNLLETANVRLRMSQTASALELLTRSAGILESLAAADPKNLEYQRDLGVHLDRLGDVLLDLNRTPEAVAQFRRALASVENLAAADPRNAAVQRDLSISLERMGRVALRTGKTDEAIGYYRRSLVGFEKICADDPNDARAKRERGVALDRLGALHEAINAWPEALDLYRRALAAREQLVRAAPDDSEFARDLGIALNNLGGLRLKQGDFKEALGLCERSLAIGQKRADAAPSDTEARRDLSVALIRLGNVRMKRNETREALGLYVRGVEALQILADADPKNVQARIDLSKGLGKMGDAHLELGDKVEALGLFQKSLALREEAASGDGADIDTRRTLIEGYFKVGKAREAMGQFAEAIADFQKALDVATGLAMPKILTLDIKILESRIASCRKALADGPKAKE